MARRNAAVEDVLRIAVDCNLKQLVHAVNSLCNLIDTLEASGGKTGANEAREIVRVLDCIGALRFEDWDQVSPARQRDDAMIESWKAGGKRV